tara:strand:- start:340 stop:684 length:345 start_codon:yes stop_codon:yes gene_type:complete
MSDKAYFVSVQGDQEMQILRSFLIKFDGVADFNYLARTKKKIKSFDKDQYIAAITVDRGDLRDAFLNEGEICTASEMPRFCTVYDMPRKSSGEPLHLEMEHDQEVYAPLIIGKE